ncbi:MAG TPA: T9SS type A sorting domain-containing protein, partial [Rubricoccaceae bacterium]
PNPTSGASTLELSLPAASAVEVSVYDVLGRRVASLAEGTLGAGAHALRVAPGALAAGTYVVRAEVGGQVLTQRLTVTR